MRDLSRSPLFQVMFALQNAPRESLELPGLTLSQLGSGGKTAKFDLTMFVFEGRQGLLVSLEYNTDCLRRRRSSGCWGIFRCCSRQWCRSRRRSWAVAVADECGAAVLGEWNETASEVRGENVVQLFEEQVARKPEQVAVMCGAAASHTRS